MPSFSLTVPSCCDPGSRSQSHRCRAAFWRGPVLVYCERRKCRSALRGVQGFQRLLLLCLEYVSIALHASPAVWTSTHLDWLSFCPPRLVSFRLDFDSFHFIFPKLLRSYRKRNVNMPLTVNQKITRASEQVCVALIWPTLLTWRKTSSIYLCILIEHHTFHVTFRWANSKRNVIRWY